MPIKLTTSEFIERARQVHGDRYDYDRTVYVNSKRKIIITCTEHGDFEQLPTSHGKGHGCPSCGGAKRLTTAEFITKARAAHGNKYDYSKSVYVNERTKVIITCMEHGDFDQLPGDHSRGKGCRACARISQVNIQTLTADGFITKSREVHGAKYDYSKSVYADSKRKVIITCPEHGDFTQRATNHIQGRGCPHCASAVRSDARTLTPEEFIAKARQVHGNKYGYSKSVYLGAHQKLIITCPEHGEFEQTPTNHTQGQGCSSCGAVSSAIAKTLNTEEFIANARRVHGDRYDYSKSVYVNSKRKITVTCPEHGDFEQEAKSHTQGSGCPSCAAGGYDPHKTGYLYFLLDTETHSRIKIGISNDPSQRIQRLRNRTPFEFEPMEIIETYGEIAPQLEKLCHDALPSAGLTGFDGATEWMRFEGATVCQLIETCESYRLLDTPLRLR